MALILFLQKETFQPEEPQIVDDHLTSTTRFTFVDFIPSVIKRSTTSVITTAEVEYHSFRDMVDTANVWLQKNPDWEVINCETIILLYKYNDRGSYYELKPNDSSFYIYGSEKTNVLKALRLWIKRKEIEEEENSSSDLQILNYLDIIPESKEDDFSGSKFETLDEVVQRVNTIIKNSGFEGRIITVESLQCEAGSNWKIDPDVTLTALSSKNVFILRIFYEHGPPCEGEIGIVDFVPRHISGGGFFKKPKFESYSDVMSRATQWLSENPDVIFKNAQSVDIKLKSLTTVDTKTMSYTEQGDYLRIFRIAYSKPMQKPSDPYPVYLASKLFMASKKNETVRDINQKLGEWANQVYKEYYASRSDSSDDTPIHKPRLLSAETVEVFCKTDDTDKEKAVDDTFQYNRFGTKNGYLFMTLRVYFDIGSYGYSRLFGSTQNRGNGKVGENSNTSNGKGEEAEKEGKDSNSSSCSLM